MDARVNALNGIGLSPFSGPALRPAKPTLRVLNQMPAIPVSPEAGGRHTYRQRIQPLETPRATVSTIGAQPAATAARIEANIDQVFAFRAAPYGDIPESLLPTDHPMTLHNEAELLVDGDVFAPLLEDLRSATDSIHICHFGLADDSFGRKIEAILAQKVRQGVDVRVLIDAAGSDFLKDAWFPQAITPTGRMLDRWEDAGIEVIRNYPINPFNRAELLNHAEHRKFYIVDGAVGWTGGMNIQEKYGREWHDSLVRTRGEIVRQMQVDFLKTWLHLGGRLPNQNDASLRQRLFPTPTVRGDTKLRGLVQIPGESTTILDTFLREINATRSGETLYIESPYITDDRILTALEAAARRGADVRMVLPGESDHVSTIWATRSRYRPLLNAGVRIFEYPGMTHAKLAAARGLTWATLGSSNLDSLSLNHVYEFNIETTSPRFIASVGAAVTRDMEVSKEITLDDLHPIEEIAGAILYTLFSYFM